MVVVMLVCAGLGLVGCRGGGQGTEKTEAASEGETSRGGEDLAIEFDASSIGEQNGRLSADELRQLWRLAQSDGPARYRALENFLATPEAARRFLRRAPEIVRATVGLDNEMRMQIAKELLAPGITSPPEDPDRKSALVRLGIELQLGDEVPGLSALVAAELSWAERLPVADANRLIGRWAADPAAARQEYSSKMILAAAKCIDEGMARQVVQRAPKNIADRRQSRMDEEVLDAAISRVAPAFGQTLAGRLVESMEKTEDAKLRAALARRLGAIPGGLAPKPAARALALVEPTIKPGYRYPVSTKAIEPIVSNLSPEAVSATIVILNQWQIKARDLKNHGGVCQMGEMIRRACEHLTVETAPQVANMLDQISEESGPYGSYRSYPAVISRLSRQQAQPYVEKIRSSDDALLIGGIAQGLAESADALTGEQRVAQFDLLINCIRQAKGLGGSKPVAFGDALAATCAGLDGEELSSAVKRLSDEMKGVRSPEWQNTLSIALAGIAERLPTEDAKAVIAALADTACRSDYHDADYIMTSLRKSLDARPADEISMHAPAVFEALSRCSAGSSKPLESLGVAIAQKIPPEQSAAAARGLVDLMAKGAVGTSTPAAV